LEKQAGLPPDVLQTLVRSLEKEGKIVCAGEYLVDAGAFAGWRLRILETLASFHRAHPLAAGMSRAGLKGALPKGVPARVYDFLLAGMEEAGEITGLEGLVAAAGHRPEPGPKEQEWLGRITALYRASGFTPPTLRELAERTSLKQDYLESLTGYLARNGELVRLDDQLLLHREHFAKARRLLVSHFQDKKTLAAAEFRDLLGTSRKFVLPLLETFDRLKWTRRLGDERVPWRLEAVSQEEVNGHGE
jgi:selenocysteine-specific elongation factor